MSILLAISLAAAIQPTCSWDRPGHNPYTGGAAAAIDHYTDIPAAVRDTLKRRMAEGQPDDQVQITRDAISGKQQYGAQIRDMHFGRGSLCASVTRAKWAADRVEPAAVYCVEAHCVLVPKICGNVSRVTRAAPALADAAGAAKDEGVAGDYDSIPQFDDISLVDAPVRDELIELGLWDLPGGTHRSPVGGLGGVGNDSGPWGFPYPPLDVGDGGVPAAAVPEPETWAMLLGGLGLVAWMARRRAARAA